MASHAPPRSPPEDRAHPGRRSPTRRRSSRRGLPGRVLLVVLLIVLLTAAGSGGTAVSSPPPPYGPDIGGRVAGGRPAGGPETGGAETGGAETGTARARAAFVPEWAWPLAPIPAVLRPFEKPAQRWQRGHRGVDLAAGGAAAGRAPAVLSPGDGLVSFAGTVVDRGVLSIDHGEGRISSFEPVTTQLVRGQRVGRGEVVATLDGGGDGGGDGPRRHCPAACLHWGVRVDGEYVDPLWFVLDRRPSVLLPLGDRG
ncbi:M23 family metallopeptidase [Arthrobacter sp. B0490]|uniref:M23 family metallopeptidase n=1 Tax=Arthrobacter sp. B0490 TaxID=2058891 RepID=UPI000CE4BA29|nr:M23 family metallopeptidase [Arthrobacter sp. B0490]